MVSGHAGASYNGKIYVFGGYAKGLALDTVEMFDPSSGKWALKTVMPEAWAEMSTGLVDRKFNQTQI